MTVHRLRHEGLEWRRVEDEVVILDVASSTYFSINDSGTVLWEALAQSPQSEDQLVDVLLEVFDVARADAQADVGLFVKRLGAQGLLEQLGAQGLLEA